MAGSSDWCAGAGTVSTGFPSFGNLSAASLADKVRCLPGILRARSAMLVGSLELGAPLGRGSYGKVYKGGSPKPYTPTPTCNPAVAACRCSFGRVQSSKQGVPCAGKWKGVTVAVKVIEHTSEASKSVKELRESMLSASIIHPNVVTTYKIRTIPAASCGAPSEEYPAQVTPALSCPALPPLMPALFNSGCT
jgi:serine/threonine protein kinase